MIKFRYTHFTNIAMFRSGWLDNITCFAFIILFVNESIIVALILLDKLRRAFISDFSGGDWACLVIDPEAESSHDVGHNNMSIRDESVWHVSENAINWVCDKSEYKAMYPPTAIK